MHVDYNVGIDMQFSVVTWIVMVMVAKIPNRFHDVIYSCWQDFNCGVEWWHDKAENATALRTEAWSLTFLSVIICNSHYLDTKKMTVPLKTMFWVIVRKPVSYTHLDVYKRQIYR